MAAYYATSSCICMKFFWSIKKKRPLSKLNAGVACEQALRGALAAGREKEEELATTSLEFQYLHQKSRSEMLIGVGDISNDLITPRHVFFNVCLQSRSFPLSADWRKSDSPLNEEPPGNWRWNWNSGGAVARCPSSSCPAATAPRRACSQANAGDIKGTATGTHYIPQFLFCSRYPLFFDLALQAKMFKARQEIWIIVHSQDRMNRVSITTFKWGWFQVSVGLKSLKSKLPQATTQCHLNLAVAYRTWWFTRWVSKWVSYKKSLITETFCPVTIRVVQCYQW